jgi:hypothetical protein
VLISYLLIVLLYVNLQQKKDSATGLSSTPIFLYTNDVALFYDGKVYQPKDRLNIDLESLPKLIPGKPPIWVLVDLEKRSEPAGLLDSRASDVFIVHSSLPNPLRYEKWMEQRNPIVIGLPLWDRELLALG